MVLDDSERIRDSLQDFGSVLAEISAVCDVITEEEKLKQSDQQVHKMQRCVLERLEQLFQAAEVKIKYHFLFARLNKTVFVACEYIFYETETLPCYPRLYSNKSK